MSGFASQIGDGSITTLDASAAWRMAEADLLQERGRSGAALYLLGYVAEIRLSAACLRVYGYDVKDLISREALNELRGNARKLKLMTPDPHHIPGWARYLLHLRRIRGNWIGPQLRDIITQHADGLYEHWRPRLRYKALTPTGSQLRVVREAAGWLNDNYNRLWN